MSIIQAIILGIVQGLGEFLPISSSAHLVLVPWFFGWPESGLAFDTALHLGTLVAVTVYFWRDLFDLAWEGLTKGTRTTNGRIGWGIVLGTIPGGLFGYLLQDKVETVFRNPLQIAILLAVVGLILYWVDRIGSKRHSVDQVSVWDVFLIGVAQAFAVIPGVSRSGATITAALLLGLKREAAAKVSFLLGWPLILGAGLMTLKDMDASFFTPAFWTGVAASAISGYAVIALLMDYLRKGSFKIFAWYRGIIAAITIALYFMRG